jgi:hypothetical protein
MLVSASLVASSSSDNRSSLLKLKTLTNGMVPPPSPLHLGKPAATSSPITSFGSSLSPVDDRHPGPWPTVRFPYSDDRPATRRVAATLCPFRARQEPSCGAHSRPPCDLGMSAARTPARRRALTPKGRMHVPLCWRRCARRLYLGGCPRRSASATWSLTGSSTSRSADNAPRTREPAATRTRCSRAAHEGATSASTRRHRVAQDDT